MVRGSWSSYVVSLSKTLYSLLSLALVQPSKHPFMTEKILTMDGVRHQLKQTSDKNHKAKY